MKDLNAEHFMRDCPKNRFFFPPFQSVRNFRIQSFKEENITFY